MVGAIRIMLRFQAKAAVPGTGRAAPAALPGQKVAGVKLQRGLGGKNGEPPAAGRMAQLRRRVQRMGRGRIVIQQEVVVVAAAETKLWPEGKVPFRKDDKPIRFVENELWQRNLVVSDINDPFFVFYPAKGVQNAPVAVIFPGGGYSVLGWNKEGTEVGIRIEYMATPCLEGKTLILVDPMLATGGSASAAIQFLKDDGVKHIKLMCIIGAPEGVKRMQEDHPDVDIFVAALDDHLNEHGYIVPGLGDAGDRIFGTK